MSLKRYVRRFLLRHFPEKVSDEVLVALFAEAEQALRGGVVHTRTEWDALSPAEQSSFVSVNERLRAESSAQIGLASLSVDSAAEVASIADGGAAKRAVSEARTKADIRRRLVAAADRVSEPMIESA